MVVLLPDEGSGAQSRVAVSNAAGAVELAASFDATTVAQSQAPPSPLKMDEAEVMRRFGAVLADLPPAPQRFDLHFRTDSSVLTDQSRALLPAILEAVRLRPAPDVTVIGHTDTTGTAANNYRLGLERARTVRDRLLKTGLEPHLVEVESHGESDPVARTPDNTPEPRNRRVEITVK
jgi:outer membrane protein OmpA-like peptidoglycan-associated protein